MKKLLLPALCGAVAACACGAGAQPPDPVERAEPIVKREIVLEAPLVSSAEAQKLALPDDIRIHLKNVTLREALRELEGQSGLPFDLSPLDAKKLDAIISVDVDTPAVTVALDAIADEANLKLIFNHAITYESWRVSENREKPAPRPAPTFVDGLFAGRLLKVDVSLFKQLDLDTEKTARTQNDNLNLTFELTPDPGVPIGGLPALRATRADDDRGRSLLRAAPPADKAEYDSGFIDAWSKRPATLQLSPPAADARKIAHLEGEAIYMVAVKRARWEVPDFVGKEPQNFDFQIGETPVKTVLSDAKIEGENVRFQLRFTLPTGASWQKFSGNLYSVYGVLPWITIRDANGTRLIPRGGGGNSGANYFAASANFVMPGAVPGQKGGSKPALPLSFRFDPPTDWVRAAARFKFEDVPLP